AGHTYYVAVYNHAGYSGNFTLNIWLYSGPGGGADNFADAAPLDFGKWGKATSDTSTESASLEPGEPHAPDCTASVWYRFQVPARVRMRFDLKQGDARFNIYRGNSVTNLIELGTQALDPEVTYLLSVCTTKGQPIGFEATFFPDDFTGSVNSLT